MEEANMLDEPSGRVRWPVLLHLVLAVSCDLHFLRQWSAGNLCLFNTVACWPGTVGPVTVARRSCLTNRTGR